MAETAPGQAVVPLTVRYQGFELDSKPKDQARA